MNKDFFPLHITQNIQTILKNRTYTLLVTYLNLLFLYKLNNKKLRPKITTYKLFKWTIQINDLQVLYRDFEELFINGLYNSALTTQKPCIIDLNSDSHGLRVLFFKWKFPLSTLKIFEPNPARYTYLQEHLKRNKIKRVELFSINLNSSQDIVKYHFDPSKPSPKFERLSIEHKNYDLEALKAILRHTSIDIFCLTITDTDVILLTHLETIQFFKFVGQVIIRDQSSTKISDSSVFDQLLSKSNFKLYKISSKTITPSDYIYHYIK